jgi:hypothetical protein
MRDIVESIQSEYRRYKKLGEGAIQQLREEDLCVAGPGESNSVAVIVWHISGNLKSRFTDFLTTDGEKPWRLRDEEFHQRKVSSAELQQKWAEGWAVLLNSLESLTDADLSRTVTIRNEKQPVYTALHRSLAHTAYHVGQIVHVAKTVRANDWKTLTIPLGKSEEYNRSMK